MFSAFAGSTVDGGYGLYTKNRLVVPMAGGGWWVKLKRVVERYKLPVNKV